MKRYLLVVLVIVCSCLESNARWFVGGTFGTGYRKEKFGLVFKPQVGFEFNDRWAVGLAGGLAFSDGDVMDIVNPYLRFNCWNNGSFYIDVKASADMTICNSSYLVGLKPSLRYAFNDHWQLATDVGILGVDIDDGDVGSAFVLSATNVELALIYRF